jgi:polar amino acid transport system substrate-binding protein
VVLGTNQEVKGPADLAGKKAAVQLGTTGDIWASNQTGVEVVRFQTFTAAFQELEVGRVAAVIVDTPVANAYVKQRTNLKIVGEPVTTEKYGLAVNKGDAELLNTINQSLEKMKQSGKYDELLAKWFPSS